MTAQFGYGDLFVVGWAAFWVGAFIFGTWHDRVHRQGRDGHTICVKCGDDSCPTCHGSGKQP